MDRRIHRLASMVQLVVGLIYDKPAASVARGGQFDEEGVAKAEQTYDVPPRRQEFFRR